MGLTINTNIPSLIAQRSLNNATNALNTSIERMSTGYTINHASDNAAGYSIANNWVKQLGSYDIASSNAATGADMLTTAEDSYALLTEHLQRIRDLTEQAANGTYGSTSLKAIQAEITGRVQEINRISVNTEFNDIYLMKGDVASDGIDIQVGLYADDSSQINLAASLFADASIYGLFASQTGTGKTFTECMTAGGDGTLADLEPGNTNEEKALNAFAAACVGMKYDGSKVVAQGDEKCKPTDMLQYIDGAITEISTRVTKIGAAQNRLDSAVSSIDTVVQNVTSSLSTLRDTDIAEESSKYVQEQILQQASTTLLATANQMPSIALSLI